MNVLTFVSTTLLCHTLSLLWHTFTSTRELHAMSKSTAHAATPFMLCGQSRCVCSWLQCASYASAGCSRLCCACGWGCASQTRTVAHAQVPPHAAGGSDAGTSIGAGVQCSCSWRCDERCVVGALRGQAAPASCSRVLSVRVRSLQLFKALHLHLRRCRPSSARWPPVRVCMCVYVCVW